MIFVKVLDNKVIDVLNYPDNTNEVKGWVQSDIAQIGWSYEDGIFSAPIITYSEKRATEYAALNQFEMQFDDQVNGTTTWVDAINDIKARFPK